MRVLKCLIAILHQSFPGLLLVQSNKLTYLHHIKRRSHEDSPVGLCAQNYSLPVFADLGNGHRVVQEVLSVLSIILKHS